MLPSAKEFWHHDPVMENKGLDFLNKTAGLIRQLEEKSKNTVVPDIFSILSQQTPKPRYSYGLQSLRVDAGKGTGEPIISVEKKKNKCFICSWVRGIPAKCPLGSIRIPRGA